MPYATAMKYSRFRARAYSIALASLSGGSVYADTSKQRCTTSYPRKQSRPHAGLRRGAAMARGSSETARYRACTFSTDASELGPWQAAHDSPNVGDVIRAACDAAAFVVWHERQAAVIGCCVVR